MKWLVAVVVFVLSAVVGVPAQSSRVGVDLTISSPSAMVGTTVNFTSRGTPATGLAGRKARLQVDAGASWRTVTTARYDATGVAQARFTSATTGTKRYRVAVFSMTTGSLVAKSPIRTVAWQRVTWTPRLSIAKSSAPVGDNVAYTVAVTPAELAAGRKVRVQVKGRVTWQAVDKLVLNRVGVVTSDVEGYEAGLGRYRAQLLSASGKAIATSPVVSVSWY